MIARRRGKPQPEESRLNAALEWAKARVVEAFPPCVLSQTRNARRLRERRLTDPRFMAAAKWRGFFYSCLSVTRIGAEREARFVDATGLTTAQMKEHIESLFDLGMGWHNRAEWHIDHIRPVCSFDLRRHAHVRRCFHFSNLRPLWGTENLRKIRFDLAKRVTPQP